MEHVIATKSILKKPLLASIPETSSWLSRIQSRLSYAEDTSFRLERQDLQRVTFSMGQLTTEHLLAYDDTLDDDDGNDLEESNPPPPPPPRISSSSPLSLTTMSDYTLSLPYCYERSCRLREEKEWPIFMDLLQTHCGTQLTSIDLTGRTIHSMGPLSDIFLLDFGLRTLRLSNCGLDDESIGTLLNSLLKTDTVIELDLSCNPLKRKSYKWIAIYIAESKSITSLDISKTSPDLHAIQYLSRGLSSAHSLSQLTMDQCALKSGHLEAIAPCLSQSPSLTSLSLRYNRFPASATCSLAELISNGQLDQTTGLQKLDLSGNPLQETSLGVLCHALAESRTLKHLILANCQIYPTGCEALADTLYTNECLESLDLSANPIMRGSDKGIHALTSALLRNKSLRQLVLTNTDLDTTAAIMIAEVLPMNHVLTRLDLSQNPALSLAGILALAVAVKMNRSITFLDISIPINDLELSDLQNDIAAVCTTNMIQQIEKSQHSSSSSLFEVAEASSLVSPSSSSSSITSTLTKEHPEISIAPTIKPLDAVVTAHADSF